MGIETSAERSSRLLGGRAPASCGRWALAARLLREPSTWPLASPRDEPLREGSCCWACLWAATAAASPVSWSLLELAVGWAEDEVRGGATGGMLDMRSAVEGRWPGGAAEPAAGAVRDGREAAVKSAEAEGPCPLVLRDGGRLEDDGDAVAV